MTGKLAALVAVVLLCVLGTGGCALIGPPDPDDFTFSSVAVVYSNDRADDTSPKRLTRNSFATKVKSSRFNDLPGGGPEADRNGLRVFSMP
jgi:hypothetical protein